MSPPWTTELVWAFREDEVLRKFKSYDLWWFYENISAFIDNYCLKIQSFYNMEVCIQVPVGKATSQGVQVGQQDPQ